MKEMHSTPKRIEPRSYGVKELAAYYFPNIAPASASTRLKQWILESSEVMTSLSETHYRRTARILTPRQVEIIVSVFGSPF